MILCAHKPALAGELDHLNQTGGGILPYTPQPGLFKLLAEVVVEFEAMTVTLLHLCSAVGFGSY